jgi:hypothetical protein
MGYLPGRIHEAMRGRNILDVALDVASGVRGSRDMCMSDCAMDLTILEHYVKKWNASNDPFDGAVLEVIAQAINMGTSWFATQASDMGI